MKTYGALNVLVNNAGIANYGPIDQYSRADWDKIIAVNLTGVFNGITAAIPALKAAGGGSIVNMSSLAGLRGEAGMPGYVATKFAVRGLTKAAALDLARYGIRVNSIHPGIVHTPLSAEGPKVSMSHVAMDRVGEPIEIANLAVFLASDESSFSTGAEFIADGGELAGLIRQSGEPAKRAVGRREVEDHVGPFQRTRGDGRSIRGHHRLLCLSEPGTTGKPRADHGRVSVGDGAVLLQRCRHSPVPAAAAEPVRRQHHARRGGIHDRRHFQ